MSAGPRGVARPVAELRGHPVVVSFLPSPGSEQEPSEAARRRRAI
jgi:hypothetical protein